MAENKKDQKIYFIVFMVFVVLLLAALYYFVFYKKEKQEVTSEKEEVVKTEEVKEREENIEEEVNTSGWKTYESEEYGYSLRYPSFYSKDPLYSIWTTGSKEISLVEEWGVNKGQEAIFVISVYPGEEEKSVIDYYNYTLTDEEIKLKNSLVAKKLLGGSANSEVLVRKNTYIYIISSTFMFLRDVSEYKEYSEILDSLKIE